MKSNQCMSVSAYNVFIFMFRLLIILGPRLNEATCLVVAHDCSVCLARALTIEYLSQSLPSLFTSVQISASANKHFIDCIICGPIFNEINFLDEGIIHSYRRLFFLSYSHPGPCRVLDYNIVSYGVWAWVRVTLLVI